MPLTSPRFKDNAQLQKAAANSPPLRSGHTGEGVRLVQQALTDLGYALPITYQRSGSPDGIYGAETSAAIKDLQRKHSLGADGVAGKDTMAKLDELLPTAGKPLKPLPGAGKFDFRIRVHLRTINTPAVSEFTQFAGAQEVFRQYGIDMQMATGQSLLLTDEERLKLNVVDGQCLWDQVSDEQRLLHDLGGRQGVGPTDILVYFANEIKKLDGSGLDGCAGHAPGRPAVMLSSTATKYAMAHEVCHVLLSSKFSPVHVTDKSNLMFDGYLGNLTKTPPVLTADQLKAVRASPYCVGA
jgi:peptidoglycan hydrolase-like protein with peptidoglycan-binding domain